jgi:hypothetical protein
LISPGTSAGILKFENILSFTQSSTGMLAIGIGGNSNANPANPQYDLVEVSTGAAMAGALALALEGSYTPNFNDSFTVFDATSLTGVFANVANGQRLATTGGEGSFIVTYNNVAGTVTLSNFILSSDYNQSGIVDAADYVLWRKNPANYDGAGGYAAWRSNFGRTTFGFGAGSGIAGSGAVPEPSVATLVFVGLAMAMFSARRTQTLRKS